MLPLDGSKHIDVKGIFSHGIFVCYTLLCSMSSTLSSLTLQFQDNMKAGNLNLKLKRSSLQETFVTAVFSQ